MNINIAYACNEAYMEQTTVSITSLLVNCSVPNQLHIFFIDMGTTDRSREEMKTLVESYGAQYTTVSFDDIAYDLEISEETGRHIRSVYAKLFFGRLSEIDRIIYLDSDTVIVDDIKELWDIELGENVIAGVETIHTIVDNIRIGYHAEDRAINDGMVLMNVRKWRDGLYLERCLDYIDEYHGNPPVLSEGTINAVCKGRILIIHPRYNLMSAIVGESAKKIQILTGRQFYSQKEIDEATKKPCIIHYLSGFYNRPWCQYCSHPMKDIYLEYRNLTKWKLTPLNKQKLSFRIKTIGFLYNHLPIRVFVIIRKLSKKISARSE